MKLTYTFLLFFTFFLGSVTLNAQQPPQIILQPVDQIICDGDSTAFFIQAIGDPVLIYQWKKNGADIPGETDSIFIIKTANVGNEGFYQCVVANDIGIASSDIARLNVDVISTTQIVGPTEVLSGEFSDYAVEKTIDHTYEFFVSQGTVVANTDTSVRVQWGIDTVGSVKMLESNVTGCYADTTSLMVIIGDVAPFITSQPVSQVACLGDSLRFEVQAEGTSDLHYQWQLNEVDIENDTNSILKLYTLTSLDEGDYTCIVSNSVGYDTSVIAVLLIDVVTSTEIIGPDEVNSTDTALYAVDATDGHTYEFFVTEGTVIETADTYVKVEWTADTVGFVKMLESNSNGCYGDTITKLVIIGNVVPFILSEPVSQVVCPDDPVSFEVVAEGTSDLHYQWQFNFKNIENDTNSILMLTSATLDDEGEYRCVVTNQFGADTSEIALLDVDFVYPIEINGPDSVAVNDTAGYFVIPIDEHTYEAYVTKGSIIESTDTSIRVKWDTEGVSYVHVVETNALGCHGDTVNYKVLVYGEGTMIEFVSQPETQTVCLNDSVSFIVEVTGYPEIKYQWLKNGIYMPNANDSILTILDVQNEDEASYSCVVSNDFDTNTSDVATLTVEEVIPTDILGPQYVDEFEVSVYSVAYVEGHIYDFEVEGGNITNSTQNSVTVHWGTSGYGFVKMLESNEIGCFGEWVELDIYIGTVGINPEKEDVEKIYPNPVNDLLNISLKGHNTLRLYNILGSLVLEKTFEDEIKLNISHLDQGMYIYRINDRTGRIFKK